MQRLIAKSAAAKNFLFLPVGRLRRCWKTARFRVLAQIEHFTKDFGNGRGRKCRLVSQERFERQRKMQINKAFTGQRKSPRRMLPKLAIPYHILSAEGFSSVVLNCLSSIVRGLWFPVAVHERPDMITILPRNEAIFCIFWMVRRFSLCFYPPAWLCTAPGQNRL